MKQDILLDVAQGIWDECAAREDRIMPHDDIFVNSVLEELMGERDADLRRWKGFDREHRATCGLLERVQAIATEQIGEELVGRPYTEHVIRSELADRIKNGVANELLVRLLGEVRRRFEPGRGTRASGNMRLWEVYRRGHWASWCPYDQNDLSYICRHWENMLEKEARFIAMKGGFALRRDQHFRDLVGIINVEGEAMEVRRRVLKMDEAVRENWNGDYSYYGKKKKINRHDVP
jgi:hypothetical protein